MKRAFISYVRENNIEIDRLASDLRINGVKIWLDRNDLQAGSRWIDAIRQAISEGQFFIACFSNEYNLKISSFMNEELTLAIDELRKRSASNKWFIPVLINKTTVPDRRISNMETLRDFNYVKLYEDWDLGIEKILKTIRGEDKDFLRIYNLIDGLNEAHPSERLYSVEQLGKLGRAEKIVIDALVGRINDSDATVRSAVCKSLSVLQAETSDIIKKVAASVEDKDADVRESALKFLSNLGTKAARSANLLLPALLDADPILRKIAAKIFTSFGADGVSALSAGLKSEDVNTRAACAKMLSQLGSAASASLPVLADIATNDTNQNVKMAAADACAKLIYTNSKGFEYLEANNTENIRELISEIQNPSAFMRQKACGELAERGPSAFFAVNALAAALEDSDRNVRESAANALGRIGPAASGAVENVLNKFDDVDVHVRLSSAQALIKIGRSSVGPVVLRLNDEDSYIRWLSITVLDGIGDDSPEVISKIVERLDDTDRLVKIKAASILGFMGKHGICSIGKLETLQNDEDPGVRMAVKWALALLNRAR